MAASPLERCYLISDSMNETNDCGVRATALTCGVPYERAYEALAKAGRRFRAGVVIPQVSKAVKSLGCTLGRRERPVQASGSLYTAKTISKAYPRGRFLVYTRNHVFALVNGKVLDWARGTRARVLSVQEVIL